MSNINMPCPDSRTDKPFGGSEVFPLEEQLETENGIVRTFVGANVFLVLALLACLLTMPDENASVTPEKALNSSITTLVAEHRS